jgi:hypothetical protein
MKCFMKLMILQLNMRGFKRRAKNMGFEGEFVIKVWDLIEPAGCGCLQPEWR